ncbi:MAG TPA: hypothetical protein VHX65_13540 [Pirellulales bacterium]|nr:hypothetical protein [Pirellulales bacterium]
MKTIARICMATACAAIVALHSPPAIGQSGPVAAPSEQPIEKEPTVWSWFLSKYPMILGTVDFDWQTTTKSPPKELPPPFILSRREEADLAKVLSDWERRSSQATAFRCCFKHWVYDPTLLPPKLGPKGELVEQTIKYGTGQIKYAAPASAMIEEKHVWEMANPGTLAQKLVKQKYGEHWLWDGKILEMIDDERRQTHDMPIAPEARAKFFASSWLGIALGLFVKSLKTQYFVRTATPSNDADEIWLDIRPRFKQDLASFIEFDVILRAEDMRPNAMQIVHAVVKAPIETDHGQKMVDCREREVYQFDEMWRTFK